MIWDEVKVYLQKLGVKVSGSVFKKSSVVVVGEKVGFKLIKVESLDVLVLMEFDFINLFKYYGIV